MLSFFKSKKEKDKEKKKEEKKNEFPEANEGHSFVGTFHSSDDVVRVNSSYETSVDVPAGFKLVSRYDYALQAPILAVVPENFEIDEKEKYELMNDGPRNLSDVKATPPVQDVKKFL